MVSGRSKRHMLVKGSFQHYLKGECVIFNCSCETFDVFGSLRLAGVNYTKGSISTLTVEY